MHEYVYIRVHAFASAGGITHSCSFWCLCLETESLIGLGWLGIHLSDFPALGSQHVLRCFTFWNRVLGIKLRPLCLQGQQFYHFTNCTVFSSVYPQFKKHFYYIFVYECGYIRVPWLTCGSQKTTFRSWLSSMWIWETKFSSSSLVGSTLTPWAVWLSSPFFYPPAPPQKKLKTKTKLLGNALEQSVVDMW